MLYSSGKEERCLKEFLIRLTVVTASRYGETATPQSDVTCERKSAKRHSSRLNENDDGKQYVVTGALLSATKEVSKLLIIV